MESKRTFADNWIDNKDNLFQLIISDAILNVIGEPTAQVIVEQEDIDENRRDYYIGDILIARSFYDPYNFKHIMYVNPKTRRSEAGTPRLSLPIARARRT